MLKTVYQEIKDSFYSLPPQFQAELGENYPQDILEIFKDYSKIYKGFSAPTETEKKFKIQLGKYKGEPIEFVGVIDGLYETDRGLIVEEHKTFSRRPDSSSLVMNVQKCLYAFAVNFFTGSFPVEVMWDYIKSTPAKQPVWLEKSQRFSTASNSNITPYSWLRACKERGITDREVLKQAKLYEGNIPNFFFRLNLDYIPEMIEGIWNDYLYAVKEVCRQSECNKVKNITYNCTFCNFQPICYAEMTGANAEYTVEKDYTIKNENSDDDWKNIDWSGSLKKRR